MVVIEYLLAWGVVWADMDRLCQVFFNRLLSRGRFVGRGLGGEPGKDGRGWLLRRRVTLIFAGCAKLLAQSRMTVLRRGGALSTVASPMRFIHVSHSLVARFPDRTFLHPYFSDFPFSLNK